MAKLYKNLIYSTAEYTRSYLGFRGVELNASASITDPSRLAYAENMYKDYEADGADVLESIPGFRRLFNCGKVIHAIYYQRSVSGNDHLIVHAGDKLLRYPVSGVEKGDGVLSDPIGTLRDSSSFGFSYGSYFYVIDGKGILRIDDNGECLELGEGSATPYVPTTYVSGQRHMEKNLLTDYFREEYYLADPTAYSYSSDGLKYSITDPNNRYCSVSGIKDGVSGPLSIPAYVTISGVEYKVIAIDNYAFARNTAITSVNIANGIKSIGLCAFYKCSAITEAVIPSSVTLLENGTFSDCAHMSSVYLGDGIASIGTMSFSGCTSLKTVYYPLDEESYNKISGISALDGKTVVYETGYEGITLSLPLHENVDSTSIVRVNGTSSKFEIKTNDDGTKNVLLTFSSIADATGAQIEIVGIMKKEKHKFSGEFTDGTGYTGFEAVCGCTVAEVFDGRIFFSGNPKLPNTVFYTEAHKDSESGELYVGRYNYFNDGVGGYKVKSMLAVRDMLAVFKEGDDGSGSIFYHKRDSASGDSLSSIYPVAYVHSGICAKGACTSFLDDPVFITSEGLYALERENINYQRNIACRSHNVNFKLLKENLSRASMCTWLGYLVVGVNGNVYLADSRATFTHPTGSREYEWFLLRGIGTYKDDERVYLYSAENSPIATAHSEKSGEIAPAKSVYSEEYDGVLYYYVEEDGIKYAVTRTDERIGGTFFPATSFISHEKYLFFSTENGDVCVFNNDKRGVAPDRVAEAEDFDPAEYAAAMADKIHPDFYGFTDHAPCYVIKTALDNCGIPHLTKNTVKNSLVIKSRSYTPDCISCYTETDRGDVGFSAVFPPSEVGFDSFTFDVPIWNVGKYTSTALAEREKRWVEKQIILSSDKYLCPISIYSITYRYCIKGKIKNAL